MNDDRDNGPLDKAADALNLDDDDTRDPSQLGDDPEHPQWAPEPPRGESGLEAGVGLPGDDDDLDDDVDDDDDLDDGPLIRPDMPPNP